MGLEHARRKQPNGAAGVACWLHQWWPPLLLCCCMVLAEAGGDPLRIALRYAREPLADGEFWRLLSGHFVHLGWGHLLLNAAALLLVWALTGTRMSLTNWLLSGALIVVVIDAGFWWLEPQLAWYVGLSGVLHGLLVAGLLVSWPSLRMETVLLCSLIVLKLAYEQLYGALPGSGLAAGGAVVVDAHLYGAVGGLLAATIVKIRVMRVASI